MSGTRPRATLATYRRGAWGGYPVPQQIIIWDALSPQEQAEVAAWPEILDGLRSHIVASTTQAQQVPAPPSHSASSNTHQHRQRGSTSQIQHGGGVSVSGGPASQARSGGLAQSPSQVQLQWAQTGTTLRPIDVLPGNLHVRRVAVVNAYMLKIQAEINQLKARFSHSYGERYAQWEANVVLASDAHITLCSILNIVREEGHLGGTWEDVDTLSYDNLLTRSKTVVTKLRDLAFSRYGTAETQALNASRTGPSGAYKLKNPPPELERFRHTDTFNTQPSKTHSSGTACAIRAKEVDTARAALETPHTEIVRFLRGVPQGDQALMCQRLPLLRNIMNSGRVLLANPQEFIDAREWYRKERNGEIADTYQQLVDDFYLELYYEQFPQARRQ